MAEERFDQAGWRAETVHQTVNNFPDLRNLSTDEKMDLIIRKVVGSEWYNEPGILPTLQKLANGVDVAKEERGKLAKAQADQLVRNEALSSQIRFLNVVTGVNTVALIVLVLRVFL